jgi:hypothetical protein
LPCRTDGSVDERGTNPTSSLAPADIETRDRPDRKFVHPSELRNPIHPGKGIARSQLAPANGLIPRKSDEPRRRTVAHDGVKTCLIGLRRLPPLLRAYPPIHAPTPAAWSLFAEKIFENRPEIRSQRKDSQMSVPALHGHIVTPQRFRSQRAANLAPERLLIPAGAPL